MHPYLERAAGPLLVLNGQNRIDQANSACLEVWGQNVEELAGRNFLDLVHADDQAAAAHCLQPPTGDLPRPTLICRHALHGDWRWWRWRLTWHAGCWLMMGQDVTDERVELRRLADKEARLEAILQTAIDGIITIDERGCIESVNPAVQTIFGYCPHELIGQNIRILMPSPYAEQHDQYLRDYLRTGQGKIIGVGREVQGRRRDGSVFPLDLAVSESTVGASRCFTGLVRDVTLRNEAARKLQHMKDELEQRVAERTRQLRAAQEELAARERLAMLGRLSGGIAHEIRNPLNAVKTSVYFLLNARQLSPDKVREHLERIDRQVTLANTVVTTLTDFARMPAPAIEAVQLQSWLPTVVASLGFPDEFEVHIDCPPEVGDVEADREQLAIALRNLLENARDAMAEGGAIELQAHQSGEWVHLNVIDHGQGIPAEQLDKVLEPYFSTKARGIGLGLAITNMIVEKNRGKLSIQSQVGRGSTFTIQLPRRDASG